MSTRLRARLGRRMRVLAACIDGPADVWLAMRMLAWRLVLPGLKWALPLPRLVRLMWWSGQPRPATLSGQRRIATLAYWLSGPARVRGLDNCLERSLLVYRYLSRTGAEPELVVGFSRRGGAVHGHVWVTLEDQGVFGDDGSQGEFESVICFGRDGKITASNGAPAPAASASTPA